MKTILHEEVEIGSPDLLGFLSIPNKVTEKFILFAHGSGSGRHSPRNGYVAEVLNQAGFGTLLIDLLTAEEEARDRYTGQIRFDIELLASRLNDATAWLERYCNDSQIHPQIGYFGASTGAAAALVASAQQPGKIQAIVARGGRPDLAENTLPLVTAPVLLIVGDKDAPVIPMNEAALAKIGSKKKQMVLLPDAGHLFEEPGTLERAAALTRDWFNAHMARRPPAIGL